MIDCDMKSRSMERSANSRAKSVEDFSLRKRHLGSTNVPGCGQGFVGLIIERCRLSFLAFDFYFMETEMHIRMGIQNNEPLELLYSILHSILYWKECLTRRIGSAFHMVVIHFYQFHPS